MDCLEWLEAQRISGGPHGFECIGVERVTQIWNAAQAAMAGNGVIVRLDRPDGYEDVHPELVAEDAIGDRWAYEILMPNATELTGSPLAASPATGGRDVE